MDAIRAIAPDGVHRIAEVDFATHIDTDAAVIAIGGVISAYYSSDDRPSIPYWKLAFADIALAHEPVEQGVGGRVLLLVAGVCKGGAT